MSVLKLIVLCFFSFFLSNAEAQEHKIAQLSTRLDTLPVNEGYIKQLFQLDTLLVKSNLSYGINKIPNKNGYIKYYQNALAWTKENNKPNTSILIMTSLFYHYLDVVVNLALAVDIGEQILKLNTAHFKIKERICDDLKQIYMKTGMTHQFLETIETKRKIHIQSPDSTKILPNENYDIANIYLSIKQYKKAISYYKKDEITLLKTNYLKRSSMYNNIGFSFFNAKKLDSAKFYYKKALFTLNPLIQTNKKDSKYAEHFKNVITANAAEIDILNGNYNEAILSIKKEIQTAKAFKEYNIYISGTLDLARIYYLQQEYDKALKTLSDVKQLNEEQQFTRFLIEALDLKAKILLIKGRQTIAETLLLRKETILDSIANIKSKNLSEIATVLYETNKKEEALKEQDLLLSKQENELIRERFWLKNLEIITTTVIVLLIITLFLIKKFKQKNKKIEVQKRNLDKSLQQKEILLKEVHHRIKNNLQIVSSLLQKQSEKSNNPEVLKFTQESQSRIQSIALIHQSLYQDNSSKHIIFRDYAKEITTHIMSSFNNKAISIKPHFNIPKVSFDMDTIIPLALILNELITNCYKYAFTNRTHGTIWITLNKLSDQQFELSIKDNGVGFSESIDEKMKESIGLNMVKGLVWQLEGHLEYYSTTNETEFKITFKSNLNE